MEGFKWLNIVGMANFAQIGRCVCYWGTWSHWNTHPQGKFTVNDINPSVCTHLIYSFLNVDSDGTIIYNDEHLDITLNNISKFIALRNRSRSTKFFFSVGGASVSSGVFSRLASSQSSLLRFAENVLQFALKHDFDGFDLDWEYPGQREGSDPVNDKGNFVLLLKEVSRVLKPRGKEFSIAVGATEDSARKSYDIPNIVPYVDFINLMTYDFHGSWNSFTGLHSALYAGAHDKTDFQRQLNVHAAVTYWVKQGAPRNKLVVGISAYGRSFTLANSGNNGINAPATGDGSAGPFLGQSGTLGYNEIYANITNNNWKRVWEPTQKCPYAVKGNQWIGYDDPESTVFKCDYIKRNNLGGCMWWTIDMDDHGNLSGEGRFPMIKLANSMMK